jgi:hypothetical protein
MIVHYFIGVVEDIDDPQFIGRVRVRAMHVHAADRSVLPTNKLPWAHVLLSSNTASVSGIGTTPHGLLPGSIVLGMWLDGESAQNPLILGTITGSYLEKPDPQSGFSDPSGKYPIEKSEDGFSEVGEVDTNRLARNVQTHRTLLKKKEEERTKDIPTALEPNNRWSEPSNFYGAKYPFNKVTMTSSGHVVEMDDTPDSERIHQYHRSGTHYEIGPDGTRIDRIVGQKYEIVHKNGYVCIKGDCVVSVDNKAKIYVAGNAQLQVDGDVNGYVAGNVKLDCDGQTDIKTEKDINIDTKGAFRLKAGGNIELSTHGGSNLTMIGSSRTIYLNSSVGTSSKPQTPTKQQPKDFSPDGGGLTK